MKLYVGDNTDIGYYTRTGTDYVIITSDVTVLVPIIVGYCIMIALDTNGERRNNCSPCIGPGVCIFIALLFYLCLEEIFVMTLGGYYLNELTYNGGWSEYSSSNLPSFKCDNGYKVVHDGNYSDDGCEVYNYYKGEISLCCSHAKDYNNDVDRYNSEIETCSMAFVFGSCGILGVIMIFSHMVYECWECQRLQFMCYEEKRRDRLLDDLI